MELNMKILPFKPYIQQAPDSSKDLPTHRTKAEDNSFENQLLKSFSEPSKSVEKITAENRLASQDISPEDLGQAGSLLNTLLSQIHCSAPASLKQVHNLDGILYYFQV
jgi:hypothetical protein